MDCCSHTHDAGHHHGDVEPRIAVGRGDARRRGRTARFDAAAQTAETASAALAVLRNVDLGRCPYAMAARPGSPRRRRRATISRTRCGRDRWRSPASPTCRTGRSSAATRKALSRRCARRRRASFTGTISSASPGWTSWSPITACAARCPPPISKRRTRRESRRSSPMSRGSTFSTASSNGWRKRIGAASGTCSSCITRPTTSAISRPARSPIRASPNSAPR